MLIAIAGSVGVGKTTIAKELSQILGIPSYSIDADKQRVYPKHPEDYARLREGVPMPDRIRAEAFDAALQGLHELRKKSAHVIVEETFHQRATRGPFLREAKKVFGGMVLILITAPADQVKKRLAERTEHMANAELAATFQRIFEPFDHVDCEVENVDLDETIAQVSTYLQKRLRRA